MKLSKITLSLIAGILTLSLGSCTKDDEPNNGGGTIYTDIVTVASTTGNVTKFTLQEKDDSRPATLTTTQSIDEKAIKPGERVVISYRTDTDLHYVDDDITVYGMATCFGRGEEVPAGLASDNADWMTSPIYMGSLWRAGKYINVIFQAYTAPEPKKCKIVLDEKTKNSEYPEMYFLFEPDNTLASDNYALFVSYSIAEIWDQKTTKGVKVTYKDESGNHTLTFTKITGLQPSKPGDLDTPI